MPVAYGTDIHGRVLMTRIALIVTVGPIYRHWASTRRCQWCC